MHRPRFASASSLLATIAQLFIANQLLQAYNRAFHHLATPYDFFELAGEQSCALVLSIAQNNLGAAGCIIFFWLDMLGICAKRDRTTILKQLSMHGMHEIEMRLGTMLSTIGCLGIVTCF